MTGMLSLDRLRAATGEALEYVSAQPDVEAVEVSPRRTPT